MSGGSGEERRTIFPIPTRPSSLPSTSFQPNLLRQFSEAFRSVSVESPLISAPAIMQRRAPTNFTAINMEEINANNEATVLNVTTPIQTESEESSGAQPTIVTEGNNDTSQDSVDEEVQNLRTQYARLRDHFQNNREAQSALKISLSFLPFFLIFLIKMVYENFDTINYLLLGITFFIALDQRLQAVLSKTNTRVAVFFFALTLTLNILLLIHYPDSGAILNGVTFQLHKLAYTGVGRTLTLIILTDIFCKTIVVGIKGVLALIPETWVGLKRKRRFFQSIEYSSQLHRAILPTPRWSIYFIGPAGYAGMHYLDLFLLIFYWIAKVREIRSYVPDWYTSVKTVMRNSMYGVKPSQEEIRAVESQCSICYSDLKTPLKLVCAHIFCEECVDTWLEEKHTCPLCRATIDKEDKSWKSGATSKFVRIY
ncbi:unnamed protein product, partial [Mesorhabditis belari]|uniref:RING-type domain-containing protein n=1 Tax=Mesorhabditis belari TaxID=2138241 RepID=A0AAF3EXP5_9BILA